MNVEYHDEQLRVKRVTTQYPVNMDTLGLLGDFVRKRREEMGLGVTALAERAGLSKSEVSALEKGRINLPTTDKRRRLAAALGVRHIDILVAAGELTEEEIADVSARWPTDDPKKTQAFEMIESLPDSALDYTITTLTMIRDSRWS